MPSRGAWTAPDKKRRTHGPAKTFPVPLESDGGEDDDVPTLRGTEAYG